MGEELCEPFPATSPSWADRFWKDAEKQGEYLEADPLQTVYTSLALGKSSRLPTATLKTISLTDLHEVQYTELGKRVTSESRGCLGITGQG